MRDVGPLAQSAGPHDVVTLYGKTSHQAFTEPDTRLRGFVTAVGKRDSRADAPPTLAGRCAPWAGRRIAS
ncbi:hypothetical protein [Streptomyces adustus]